MSTNQFKIQDVQKAFGIPTWLPRSAWQEHIPFAMYLISEIKPKIFVELGTHYGVSYFSFCESVLINKTDTMCYAVDTWEGDPHAGNYDNKIYSELNTFNHQRYVAFSCLIKKTFDDALSDFADGSIDLLHIDGYHTYEAVKHDFETWLPKMSKKGIILFHDVTVRRADFGVWRFWNEISAQYPNFHFNHGHGLGVLFVGETYPEGNIERLFNIDDDEKGAFRELFSYLGKRWKTEYEKNDNLSAVRERDVIIKQHNKTIRDKEKQIEDLNLSSQSLRRQVDQLTQQLIVADKERQVRFYSDIIQEKEHKHSQLNQENDNLITGLKSQNKKIANYEKEIKALKSEIRIIKKSTSWRVTAPLRAISRVIRSFLRFIKTAILIFLYLITGNFNQAVKLFYPTYVKLPNSIKAMIPVSFKGSVQNRLLTERQASVDIQKNEKLPVQSPSTVTDLGHIRLVSYAPSDPQLVSQNLAEYIVKKNGKNRIALYTVIVNDYDTLKIPEHPHPAIDYFCFTNTPMDDYGIFQIRPIDYFFEDPTRASRYLKTHPHHYFPDYDIVIWIDANIMQVADIMPMVQEWQKTQKAIGAIPHPLRNTPYEEAQSCFEMKKDDTAIIQQQIDFYRSEGYECNNLIESNILFFDMTQTKIEEFFRIWWSEINRFSKRDQLSMNYALDKVGIDYHPIMKKGEYSARNHPNFRLMRHASGLKQNAYDISKVQLPPTHRVINPYDHASFFERREEYLNPYRQTPVDIVICVHNALDDVRQTLESIFEVWTEYHRIILIDDGSDEPTRDYLVQVSQEHQNIVLSRSDTASGYTKAVNRGMRLTEAPYVILLNSDTIVSRDWVEKLVSALDSSKKIGVVGPLSNAASHQSIPNAQSTASQTAINPLLKGLTIEQINSLCEQWTNSTILPKTPLIHGFCMAVKRELLDDVGLMDEEKFPNGYGEENDWCLRAGNAGWDLAVATHTYIYHAKSKSYSEEKRLPLMKQGAATLREIHTNKVVERAIYTMKANPILLHFQKNAEKVNDGEPVQNMTAYLGWKEQ
jgi:GT2 family glycosyltransferase